MHHSEASTARCRLVSGQDDTSLFSSVLALAGVLTDGIVAAEPLVPLSVIGAASFTVIEQLDTPDVPPPRTV